MALRAYHYKTRDKCMDLDKKEPSEDIWRATLANIELMIRADGDIEVTLDKPDEGELIKAFDDWNLCHNIRRVINSIFYILICLSVYRIKL